MVLTRQFTKWSMLDDKDGCQGLSHGKEIGTCQHVFLQFVPTHTGEADQLERYAVCPPTPLPLFVLPQWARNTDCTRAGRRNTTLGSISVNHSFHYYRFVNPLTT